MAKYDYADIEEFTKAVKAAGAKTVGVVVLVKNDEAAVPVATEKGSIVQGRRVSAVRLLTSAARARDGSEDYFAHQMTVLEEVITSEKEAEDVNKAIEKIRGEIYAEIQKEQLLVFHGRVSV